MIVYVITYCVLCAMALKSMRLPKEKSALVYWIGCGILLFLMCFRDVSVGADTANYCSNFLGFRANTWQWCFQDVNWEWGFVVLMKLLGYVIPSANGFIIVMGIVNLIPLMLMIRDSSRNPIMSLILFYTMMYTAAEYLYRQWIALLILLLAYRYVVERKPVKFLVCVAVAALFHRSALIFIVVYVLYCLTIKTWMIAVALAGSVFFALTGDLWLMLAGLVARMPLENAYNGGVTMMLFLWACVLVIYLVSRKRLSEPYFKLHFILLVIAATTQPISFTFSLWSRVVLYFRVSLIFLLPQTMQDLIQVMEIYRVGELAQKIIDALRRVPVVKTLPFEKILLPQNVQSYQAAKLVMPMCIVFYLMLFVYFWMNGIHGFRLMRF